MEANVWLNEITNYDLCVFCREFFYSHIILDEIIRDEVMNVILQTYRYCTL